MSNAKVQVSDKFAEPRVKATTAQQRYILEQHPAYNLESITPSRYRTPHGKYGTRINLITLVHSDKKSRLTFVEEIG